MYSILQPVEKNQVLSLVESLAGDDLVGTYICGGYAAHIEDEDYGDDTIDYNCF